MFVFPRLRVRFLLAAVATFSFVVFFLRSSPTVSISNTPGPDFRNLEQFMNHGRNAKGSMKKSSFDWSKVPLKHLPPKNPIELPRGAGQALPPVQHVFAPESPSAAKIREARRDQVRQIFKDDWQQYRKYAWKKDAFTPLTAGFRDQFSGWAATLVDSLDTLWIMGLREEFEEAVAAVAEIDFGKSSTRTVNSFETTIRYLGGLLAAYDLSGREVLLAKAIELGDFLYSGFNTEDFMPVDFINFELSKLGTGLNPEGWVVSASPGTLSLEMTRLAQITNNSKYYDVVARLMGHFHRSQNSTLIPGLWPIWISLSSMDFTSRKEFTLGASADSLYEYLPKMYALLGGLEPMYKIMTERFIAAADKHLFFRPMVPGGEDILISGNVDVGENGEKPLDPESEHLTCFIGGAVALGGKLLGRPEHVETGAKLAKGCAYAYHSFASGVMPERYNMVPCEPRRAAQCPWDEKRWEQGKKKRPEWKDHLPKGFTTAKDPRYILRPEAIESVFLLHRMTGLQEYQESAWKMFESVTAASKTKNGHAVVRDVTKVFNDETRDKNLDDFTEVSTPLGSSSLILRRLTNPDFLELLVCRDIEVLLPHVFAARCD